MSVRKKNTVSPESTSAQKNPPNKQKKKPNHKKKEGGRHPHLSMSKMEGATKVKLLTPTGGTFDISLQAARQSVVLNGLLEVLDEQRPTEIPVNVPTHLLGLIVEYLEHHRNRSPDDPLPAELEPWDANLFDNRVEDLGDILNAASMLDIPGLVDGAAIAIANLGKGMDPLELSQGLSWTGKPVPSELLMGESQHVGEMEKGGSGSSKRKR